MNFKTSSIALALSMAFANTSLANSTTEQEIEHIIVSGEFRDKNIQQTTSAVSVLSDIEIGLRNAQNLEEVIAQMPNVNFSSGSSRARYYQIRGIGERSQFSQPVNPSVGIVIDGVDFSGIGSVATMFDVNQVEVYRGPQGTRFGANALAGLINIETNKPSDTFEGKVKLLAGNYNTQGLGSVVSGPITEGVNYRIAAEQFKNDGFITNNFLKREDTNQRDELSVNAKLAIETIDNIVLDINFKHLSMDNGYDAFSLDNTRETLSDNPGTDSQNTNVLSSNIQSTHFDEFVVEAFVSFADSNLEYGYDEDWTYEGIHPWEYASIDTYYRDRESVTTELRAVSNDSSKLFDQTTDWVVGVYNRSEKEGLTREYTYIDTYTSDFDTNNFAVYGQLDSQLNDKLLLTSGIRIEQRSADFINSGTSFFNPKETMIGGKLVLAYQEDQDTLYYGSINRGYKAGGFNTDGSLAPEFREYDAETLMNYEIGGKFFISDANLSVRTALFYSDRTDMQVKSSYTKVRDDGSVEFIGAWLNASEGENKGIEVESTWYATDKLTLSSSLGLLSTQYTNYVNGEGLSLDGREQAHAPKYQYNVSANYVIDNHWSINVTVEGKDAFYVSDSPKSWTNDDGDTFYAAKTDSYSIVNASINYQNENWLIKAWARNLLDEDYYVRGFDSFGNDPRKYYVTEPYFQFGEPAVFGATVEYSF